MPIPDNAPRWLKDADTLDADVTVDDYGCVAWHGGVWLGGVWLGGRWFGGEWHGGEWRGGRWNCGVWKCPHTERIPYMLALLGIVPDANGVMTAYRTTNADRTGKHTHGFVQESGRVDVEHELAGRGTCCAGLHVTTAARAWNYFGVDPTALLWRATFTMNDVLDCDGEKVRLKGATCEQMPWPFVKGGKR